MIVNFAFLSLKVYDFCLYYISEHRGDRWQGRQSIITYNSA